MRKRLLAASILASSLAAAAAALAPVSPAEAPRADAGVLRLPLIHI